MNFNGIWQNTNNQEKIKFSGDGDDYWLEYGEENNKFKTSEQIRLFKTNDQHTLLPSSKKFSRSDVYTLSHDKIQIGNDIYIRL